jgi:hypothetical protein
MKVVDLDEVYIYDMHEVSYELFLEYSIAFDVDFIKRKVIMNRYALKVSLCTDHSVQRIVQ